jgi:hypothetical protein
VSRIAAIVARELRSLVYSPIAWIVWTLFLFVAGWFFFSSVYQFSTIVATYFARSGGWSEPVIGSKTCGVIL